MRIANIFLALILTTGFLTAQSSFTVKEADMEVKGTSSLHDWASPVTEVNAKGSITVANGELKSINNLTVTIPVLSIKSTKGKVMDNKTYEALKSDANPNITYQLTEVKSITKTAAGFQVKATGKLTIAGTAKTVDMTVDGKVLPDGSVQFKGTKMIKMTEFSMTPPTALLGTIKTGDEVTIVFSVTLGASRS